MTEHATSEPQVPVVKLASVLHAAFSRSHAAIFDALMTLATGEAVKTKRKRRDGSAVWLTPNVAEVLSAQRLLYDRVWGKAPQALLVASADAGADARLLGPTLLPEEQATLQAVWHAALVRGATSEGADGPTLDAQLAPAVQEPAPAQLLDPGDPPRDPR